MSVLDTAPAGYRKLAVKYAPYSASRLIIASCPARYLSKYIHKDKIVSDSVNASRGSAIHYVLERISRAHVEKTELTPVIVDRWIQEALAKSPAAYDQVKLIKDAAVKYAGNVSPYLNETTLCEVPLAVELYEEESFLDDAVLKKAYIKVPYEIDGFPNPKAFFGAKLDQLSFDHEIKQITVLDHKSTPTTHKNPDHVFQLGCYAWIASLFYPGYQVRTVIHYAHPELNCYEPPRYWNTEDLADIEDEIHLRIRAIESFEEFPAIPGSNCDYCHQVQLCPESTKIQEQNARGEINLNVNSTEDLQRIARQLRVTGVLYDQLNKTLKNGLEKTGMQSIAIEGMWYGYKVSDEKVDWDATDRKIREEAKRATAVLATGSGDAESKELAEAQDLSGILSKYGVTPEAFKAWRSDKLKALWKLEKPKLMTLLKRFVVLERDTRFGGYKMEG